MLGITLSNDQFPDKRFDFQFANPPYGYEWSKDDDAVTSREHMQNNHRVRQELGQRGVKPSSTTASTPTKPAAKPPSSPTTSSARRLEINNPQSKIPNRHSQILLIPPPPEQSARDMRCQDSRLQNTRLKTRSSESINPQWRRSDRIACSSVPIGAGANDTRRAPVFLCLESCRLGSSPKALVQPSPESLQSRSRRFRPAPEVASRGNPPRRWPQPRSRIHLTASIGQKNRC